MFWRCAGNNNVLTKTAVGLLVTAAALSQERGRLRSALFSRLALATQAGSGGARVSTHLASPTVHRPWLLRPRALGWRRGRLLVVLLAEDYCRGLGDFPGIAHLEPVLIPNRVV